MTEKVLVTFSDELWKIITKDVMPQIGVGESEVVRTMVIAYLEDKGYLLKVKPVSDDVKKELASHEIMIATLVAELSSKGLINFDSWEKKVEEQVK